jgi:beta-glucosidase-like glycosyl hydrolase
VVNAAAATTAVTAGRDVTLRTAQESITLPRNQNNLLPPSTRARLMVVGPSSDSMTNRLGSWSVSWQASLPATTSAAWVRQARSHLEPPSQTGSVDGRTTPMAALAAGAGQCPGRRLA